MSGIFGHLNVSDSDRVFSATVGQRVIYETAMEWINMINGDINAALAIFVEEETSDHKRRYKLPGSGYLQKRNRDGSYSTVKAVGQWDIALPLDDWGAQVAGNDVDMRYMSIADLDRHLNTVVAQNINTIRYEVMKALFNNAQDSITDPDWGTLLIEPLANGDSVVYPPILGATAEATENHYIETNYTVAQISTTNDPIKTIKDELEEHFGVTEGGSDIVAFMPADISPYVEGLTGFVKVSDRFVMVGDNTAVIRPLPLGHPGTLLGRYRGVWCVEWRHLPATYMIGIDPNRPAPLLRRRDPEDTGLMPGLTLVAEDEKFPFKGAYWRNRFGYGVGNRLNGIVLEIAAGGSYTVPTAYQ